MAEGKDAKEEIYSQLTTWAMVRGSAQAVLDLAKNATEFKYWIDELYA